MKKFLMAGAAVLALSAAGTGAHAAQISGNFGATFRVASTSTLLSIGSTLDITRIRMDGDGNGAYSVLADETTASGISAQTPLTMVLQNGESFSFSFEGVASFTGTLLGGTSSLTQQTPTTTLRSISILAFGTISPSSPSTLPVGSAATPALATLTFNQSVNIEAETPSSITGSFTFVSPASQPPGVPAPMSLALFGMGLAGLGLVARARAAA